MMDQNSLSEGNRSKFKKFAIGLFRIVVAMAIVNLVGFIISVGYFFYLMGNGCQNSLVESISSPDKSYKAVIFVRDCGATTGFSTQVSILKIDDDLDNSGGNILVTDSNHGADTSRNEIGGPFVLAEWQNENTLILKFSSDTRVFKQKEDYRGIQIQYKN
jgi:hypothetical protein